MPAAEPLPQSSVYENTSGALAEGSSESEGEAESERTEEQLEIEKLRRLLSAKDEMIKKLKENQNAANSKQREQDASRVKELELEIEQKEQSEQALQRQLASLHTEMERLKSKADKVEK